MTRKYGLNRCLQFALPGLLGWLSISLFTPKTQAQQSNIVPDNTLGAESSQVIDNFQGLPIEVITGGATRQINLFHSFQEFNISEGRGAYFFSPSANIQNILARVTGNNHSEILGTLGTFGSSNPNIFLINPNGIVFGENASLDVQGSFVGTTANAVQFGNQGVFSATNPQAAPLLTINPSVLLFNQIQANGGIINQSQAPAGVNPIGDDVTGLRVADGKSLLLVGGNINIDGGGIRAYGGNVELAGLAAPGNVGLNIAGDNFGLVIPENVERADVSLSNGAEVNVRGAGGGNITIQARNVNLVAGSILRAGIDTGLGTPNSKGGDIGINATADTTLIDESGIANVVQEGAFGNAGDINITTGTLTLEKTGLINANLYGQGNAGNVNINAQGDISFRNSRPEEANGIVVKVNENAIGNGGNVTLNTNYLEINDGSEIQGNIYGKGNSGNIIINARNNISLDGNSGNIFSRIINDVQPTAEGNAGNIQITTSTLKITNGAFISSGTSGKGNGGNISINALNNIVFDTNSTASSDVFNEGVGVGNGGNIYLKTGFLSLTNGSQISTNVLGRGNAGNITIEASGNVKLDGVFIDAGKFFLNDLDYDQSSGLKSNLNIGGVGNAGNIQVTTGSLSVTNGAGISSFTAGVGNGGNITINARDNITFSGFGGRAKNGSIVSTEGVINAIGNGGDIRITASNLLLKDGGRLNSINGGQGNGGNIFLNVGNTITINGVAGSGLSYSGVDTEAFNSNAGNIQIETGSLFLTNGGRISSPVSEGKGNGGNITINARDTVIIDGVLKDVTYNVGKLDISSGLFSSLLNGEGKGGDIEITTGSLSVTNGATISGSTGGQGNGGNITIKARDTVTLDGGKNGLATDVGSDAGRTSTGNAGNIRINARELFLKNGAILGAFSGSPGNGGNIFIDTRDAVTFDGSNGENVLSGAYTFAAGSGNSGNIQVKTGTLTLTNGGIVNASTSSTGNAGNITIDASDRILIDAVGTTGFSSGIFSAVNREGVGNGGNINLTTSSLFLNRGLISSSSVGQGKAGDININSDSATLNNQGFIAAITNSGNGGNINLTIDGLLLLRGGSEISTTAGTAQSSGDGGNIDINSRFIIAIPQENSDITANAFTGTGGNVKINSQGIFGIESRPKPTEKSDITASSEQGVAGEIDINIPDNSFIQNSFTELFSFIDTNALIANSCISRGMKRQENSFTVIGSGGLSNSRPSVSVSTYTTGEVRGVETTSVSWKKGDQIIEPQGLYRTKNGELLLSRECSK
ncbi:Filamentous hemagglutinin FhaB/tRNA nuclease CdiA-like TPS domain-containing protein [Nostoc sp. DSM 114161]|jgi:filamentous hemagglutinin family protein|uniref:beta strand repeat-containing protein n=1 Tax=Nostoc sp. DSM 114161 TaxID=3440143 RepID=UPI0040457842